MSEVWQQLDPVWKAAGALVGAILIGLTFGGWLGLPAQVEQNTSSISNIEETIRVQDSRWRRVLCHLEEQRQASPEWERCERIRND